MTALPYLPMDAGPLSRYACPPQLTSDSRVEFRTRVLEALEAAATAGSDVVILDLSAVVAIDAIGLGILVLLQKRAQARGIRVRLDAVPEPVARMLDATRLTPLFHVVRAR